MLRLHIDPYGYFLKFAKVLSRFPYDWPIVRASLATPRIYLSLNVINVTFWTFLSGNNLNIILSLENLEE